MATKVYRGNVSIILNTKQEVALKADPEGQFNATNAEECYKTLVALAKKHKASICKWALYLPEGGSVPVLIATRWGAPQIGILKPRSDGGAARKTVIKLA
jgi:hypothetical protein